MYKLAYSLRFLEEHGRDSLVTLMLVVSLTSCLTSPYAPLAVSPSTSVFSSTQREEEEQQQQEKNELGEEVNIKIDIPFGEKQRNLKIKKKKKQLKNERNWKKKV